MYLVISHSTAINGKNYEALTENLLNTLEKEGYYYSLLRHFFNNDLNSEYYTHKVKKQFKVFTSNQLFRYFQQVLITIKIVRNAERQNKSLKIIAINPLNALGAILGARKSKVVFYSSDYSTSRFGIKILDRLYVQLDKWVAKRANVVWSVSSRIQEVRRKQGLEESKNIFLPNAPSIKVTRSPKIMNTPLQLICLGMLDKQFEYDVLFRAIKEYKKPVRFVLVGSGPLENQIQLHIKQLKLQEKIFLPGFLPREDALKLIKESDIGIALYNGKWSFNYFGDSVKCREYMALGLPTITTATHSTADEIKRFGTGEIVNLNKDAILAAVDKITKNYTNYSNNARNYAMQYEGRLEKLLSDL